VTQVAKDITQLLVKYGKGDENALAQLLPEIYENLHRLAIAFMRKENPNHTLQPTALVNEAFLKLTQGGRDISWQNRAHFFAVAAQMMRRILIDHAKAKRAAKRGGGGARVSFDEKIHAATKEGPDLLALDSALDHLAKTDERQARLVELRYFGGLSIEETAEVMQISPATVKREWAAAKLWLYRELKSQE
jgi:RNA polymerase sigma factor (TIGR02999 family)